MADSVIHLDTRLEDFRKEFRRDWEADKPWRLKRKEWLDFYHGRQWTSEEIEELKSRGQPVVVRNRIKPKVDAMVGVELALKVNTKALDRGSRDFQTALHISEALRLIEDSNDFDTVEAKAFSSALKVGRGWYETTIDWVDFEAFTVTELLPSSDVTPDRNGRKDDMSDWQRVHHTFHMRLEDAIATWPEKEHALRGSITSQPVESVKVDDPHRTVLGDQYNNPEGVLQSPITDESNEQVRIVRTWYREHEVKRFVTHSEIGTEDVTDMSDEEIGNIKDAFAGATVWVKRQYTMNYVTFCDKCILEDEKNVRDYDQDAKFPITLVPGWYDEDKRMHFGIIEQLMDPQKEVNKRGSKALHLLNTNQIEMEEGAVDDENRTRYEASRPDGMIIRRMGKAFQIHRNQELTQGHFQLMQEAKGEIDASGAASELVGQSRASSGKEFQLRQQAAIQPIRELFLNLRGARRRVALLWLDDIQQYWTGERFVKLTDMEESAGVTLNQRVVNPMTGQVEILNDVSIGRYDIKIEEAPDTLNLRSENFEQLMRMAEAGIPVPPDMIIESSQLPSKNKLLQGMQQQQQMAQQVPVQGRK